MISKTSFSKKAQTLVEFALILPFCIFLVVILFDFGRAIYYYNAIHNAAREGARFGAIHPSADYYPAIKAKAIDFAIGLGLTESDIDVGPGPDETVASTANPTIKVTITYCFEPVTPLLETILSADECSCDCAHIPLIADAIMRTEALP